MFEDSEPNAASTNRRPRRASAAAQRQPTHVDVEFERGGLERLPTTVLRMHLLSLANQPAKDVQRRDVIRSMLLNDLLLQRQIERMHRRSAVQYWIVGALAGAVLLTSIIDIVVSLTREPLRIEAPHLRPAPLNGQP